MWIRNFHLFVLAHGWTETKKNYENVWTNDRLTLLNGTQKSYWAQAAQQQCQCTSVFFENSTLNWLPFILKILHRPRYNYITDIYKYIFRLDGTMYLNMFLNKINGHYSLGTYIYYETPYIQYYKITESIDYILNCSCI